jgi:hypothetical protein
MAISPNNVLNLTLLLAQNDSLPFDLWHQSVSFIVEPKLRDYIIMNDHVIHITPSASSMTPIRLFKHKHLLPNIHRKTFGSKLQDSLISFAIFDRRRTIQDVLPL